MKSDKIRNKNIHKECTLLIKAMILIALTITIRIDADASENSQSPIEVDTAVFMREARQLQELLVNPGHEKYSTKDNPAVLLVREIRNNSKKGDPRLLDHYNYDQYDKITLGLLDVSEEDLDRHDFLKDYLDTTAFGRRTMLKVMLNEKSSTKLYSRSGKKQKTVVRDRNSQGIGEMFDVGNVDAVLEDLLREIDIYDNDITLMSNRFPSPLSTNGNLHYRYFISDTLDIDGVRCVQLTFMPRNPADFTFSGNLYSEAGDSTGFIRKVSMKVPRTVNINFVDNIYIEQMYEKDEAGHRHKISDRLSLDLCIAEGTRRFSAERSTFYDNFRKEARKDLRKAYEAVADMIYIDAETEEGEDYLTPARGKSLTPAESNIGSLMSRLREIPVFYWAEKILVVLVKGYIKTGKRSMFDIGPINTLISVNSIEGVRLRLGGMTTANLSDHLFASGYVAYGTRDRKWKYKGELEYSFYKKKYNSNEFPVNSIRVTHMYDLDMIGQHYHFTNPDNVFLSLKRKKDMLVTYRHLTKLEYNIELDSRLSFGIWGEHIRQDASEWLPFIDGHGRHIPYYRRTGFGFSVRFAPGEKFIQEGGKRLLINGDAPVFLLRQEWGPKNMRGAHFSLCKTELSAQKRFWFSSFGYLDAIVKGGIIWSQIPYTELLWQNANLSYTIQPESYSLMNPMEFAMDRYASCDLTYWGNGVIFNRIPVVKLARFREVIGFKCLWGDLSQRNNPAYNSNLYRFPADAGTTVMGKTPYMEISAGIDNIFRILRIDYVWRLSYLDSPGIDRSGLRVGLHFKF